MKWLTIILLCVTILLCITVVLLLGLFFSNNGFESFNPPQEVYIVPRSTYNLPLNSYSPQQNPVLFDDFDGKLSLYWNVMGVDPAHWSLDKVPGSLTITTEDGTFTRQYTGYKNIFVIDFPGDGSEDFQVTTCVSHYNPHDLWNRAGLVLWNDKRNNFLFVYEYGEGPPPNNARKLLFTVAREINDSSLHGWYETEQVHQKMWLRIVKRDNLYILSHSTDGEYYKPMKVIQPARLAKDTTVPCLNEPLKYIGIFADNGTALGAAQVDASFEFFELKILPKE